MIAATPTSDTSLGLVRLIFSLAANPSQNVPEGLKSHLVTVITEAKALHENPHHVSAQTSSESIALALEMSSNPELTAAVDEITTFESISTVIANKVLEKMRHYSAY
ncbi:MAG: hypothetical protein M0R33_08910 [Methylomonas sp.]|jgi:hypothetical protein|uniref:hypothetical protein n=1 Tax=Methylomonas sp. TaxID=418 RepID=UPI0025E0E2E5|nr:hypothetical protein [Methylomonas sp.]MCK9606555.1 hypothetical protein [Methylomonas sp.]